MREFDTGATRDSEEGKADYEGFLSPLVIEAYGEYMHQHRKQADGKLRDSDNWQRGMGLDVYIKSLWRHFLDLWMIHREHPRYDKKDGHQIMIEEALCAVLFNVMGYLHEVLTKRPMLKESEIISSYKVEGPTRFEYPVLGGTISSDKPLEV